VICLSAALVSCTNAPRESLSDSERATARATLSQWEEGTIASYTAKDGALLRARVYAPAGRRTAVVVAVHGLQTHSRWYAPLAGALGRSGIAVFAIDRRGSGLNKTPDNPGQLTSQQDYSLWLDDISSAIHEASRRYNDAPVYLVGNSWGGNPVLAWAVRAGQTKAVRGVILLTPGLSARKPTFLQKLTIAFSPGDRLLGTCLAVTDYSRKHETWALLEEDPHLTRTVSSRFFKQSDKMRSGALKHLSSIRVPLLTILAADDELMKNDAITDALRQGVSSNLLEMRSVPNRAHLLLTEDPAAVASEISGWLARHS
jgi:alpha-beta hydrolase superfamily lysophospholipase